jgi:TM2 domain-containing membrane protein YozV
MDNVTLIRVIAGIIFLGLIVAAILAIANAAKPAKTAEIDEFELMKSMNDGQRMLFQGQLITLRKSPAVGVLLAFFLGGLGAHRFYMGQVGLGIVYAIFCWTFIPAIVSFFEAFLMSGRVSRYNVGKAMEIAGRIRGLQSIPAQ